MLFVEKETIELFLDILEFEDPESILKVLKEMDVLLEFLTKQTEIRLSDKRIKEALNNLQYHPNIKVYEESQKVIEKYFSTE